MTHWRKMSIAGWSSIAVLYASLVALEWYYSGLPEPTTESEKWTPLAILAGQRGAWYARTLLLCLAAFIAGMWRTGARSPLSHLPYRRWLAFTPWRPGLPLPRGPLMLQWYDWIVIAAVTTVSVFDLGWPVWAWPLIYFAAYSFGLWTATVMGPGSAWETVVAFLWPALFFPHHRVEAAALVAVFAFGIMWWVVRNRLKQFPFDDPDWRSENEVVMPTAKKLRFPYSTLGPGAAPQSTSIGRSLVYAALVAWYLTAAIDLFILLHAIHGNLSWQIVADELISDWGIAMDSLWLVATSVLVLIAWGRLRVLGGPPISLIGRIRTGRWIIPGYDQIYLRPIAVATTALLGPSFFNALDLPPQAVVGLSMFITFATFVTVPPSRERWQLTGLCGLTPFIVDTDKNPHLRKA